MHGQLDDPALKPAHRTGPGALLGVYDEAVAGMEEAQSGEMSTTVIELHTDNGSDLGSGDLGGGRGQAGAGRAFRWRSARVLRLGGGFVEPTVICHRAGP